MNWIEEAFLRLTNLTKNVMETACKRDEEIAQRVLHDEKVVKEGFETVVVRINEIHQALQFLANRISTLETLAGKEMTDDMGRPRFNTKQGGNA